MRTALYRHFNAKGQLLYVGVSLNSIQRTMQHKTGARWFEHIARITIEWLETRTDAEAAEREAIRREGPQFNTVHNHGVRPLKQAKNGVAQQFCWAVRHRGTGRMDGWYRNEAEGRHMFGWWCAMFPSDRFELIPMAQGGTWRLSDEGLLRLTESERWASGAPNYAAGDRFDREAA